MNSTLVKLATRLTWKGSFPLKAAKVHCLNSARDRLTIQPIDNFHSEWRAAGVAVKVVAAVANSEARERARGKSQEEPARYSTFRRL